MKDYKCSICKKELEASETYEYRGAFACEEHFEEAQGKRDFQRETVMEITEYAVSSQRKGHFVNNLSDKTMRFAGDGLPIIKVKEPLALQEYEGRAHH